MGGLSVGMIPCGGQGSAVAPEISENLLEK